MMSHEVCRGVALDSKRNRKWKRQHRPYHQWHTARTVHLDRHSRRDIAAAVGCCRRPRGPCPGPCTRQAAAERSSAVAAAATAEAGANRAVTALSARPLRVDPHCRLTGSLHLASTQGSRGGLNTPFFPPSPSQKPLYFFIALAITHLAVPQRYNFQK